MTLVYVLFAIIGIGIIIFIHELGHFLAAKKVGIRVERFALGFDPPFRGRHLRFFSFRRGETEYVLGMIPFGGYVKMAGEMLSDTSGDRRPADDEFLAKSIGARAFVLVAGAAMNIASAFIFFALAFAIGVPFMAPVVGKIVPGEPAWQAGLRAGDEIISINGERATRFEDLVLKIALSSRGEKINVGVRRPAESAEEPNAYQELSFVVEPKWDEELGMREIGVVAPVSPILRSDPAPETWAARAGLGSGDEITGVRIAGTDLSSLPTSLVVYEILASESGFQPTTDGLELRVRDHGSGAERWVPVDRKLLRQAEGSTKILVAVHAGDHVRAIAPRSSADEILDPGDRIVTVAGASLASITWRDVARLEGETLALEIESKAGETRRVDVAKRDLLLWTLQEEILWGRPGVIALSVDESSPLRRAGLEPNDIVLRAGGDHVWNSAELEEQLASTTSGKELALEVLRAGERRTITVRTPPASEDWGVAWSAFPPIDAVTGGPADRAGIESGSRLIEFDGKTVDSFPTLQELVSGATPGADVAARWIDPNGEVRSGTLTLKTAEYEPIGLVGESPALGPLENVLRAGLGESFGLGVKSTVDVGKQVFLTLRSLVKQDVSAKNLSGPVGITRVFQLAAESGLGRFLYFLAMVSVNLGLLNLFPFPILDGGHLLFLLIEKIKGSPVSIRVQEVATSIAFFLILALFLFVTFHDVRRILPF